MNFTSVLFHRDRKLSIFEETTIVAMKDFFEPYQNQIKRKLESYKCPTHDKNPVVTFTNNRINVSCCCDDFRKRMIAKSEKLMGDILSQDLNNRIRQKLR